MKWYNTANNLPFSLVSPKRNTVLCSFALSRETVEIRLTLHHSNGIIHFDHSIKAVISYGNLFKLLLCAHLQVDHIMAMDYIS